MILTSLLTVLVIFLAGFVFGRGWRGKKILEIGDLSEKQIYELECSSALDYHGRKVGLVRRSLDPGDGKLIFCFLPDYVFKGFGVHTPFKREGDHLLGCEC